MKNRRQQTANLSVDQQARTRKTVPVRQGLRGSLQSHETGKKSVSPSRTTALAPSMQSIAIRQKNGLRRCKMHLFAQLGDEHTPEIAKRKTKVKLSNNREEVPSGKPVAKDSTLMNLQNHQPKSEQKCSCKRGPHCPSYQYRCRRLRRRIRTTLCRTGFGCLSSRRGLIKTCSNRMLSTPSGASRGPRGQGEPPCIHCPYSVSLSHKASLVI